MLAVACRLREGAQEADRFPGARIGWSRTDLHRAGGHAGLARPEVRPAVEKARTAGIRTIMITGDYPDTARSIAHDIRLLRPVGQVVTGAELGPDEATRNCGSGLSG